MNSPTFVLTLSKLMQSQVAAWMDLRSRVLVYDRRLYSVFLSIYVIKQLLYDTFGTCNIFNIMKWVELLCLYYVECVVIRTWSPQPQMFPPTDLGVWHLLPSSCPSGLDLPWASGNGFWHDRSPHNSNRRLAYCRSVQLFLSSSSLYPNYRLCCSFSSCLQCSEDYLRILCCSTGAHPRWWSNFESSRKSSSQLQASCSQL